MLERHRRLAGRRTAPQRRERSRPAYASRARTAMAFCRTSAVPAGAARVCLNRSLTQLLRVLIASTNPGKVAEYRALFDGAAVGVCSAADVGALPPVNESGATYAENARAKACAWAAAWGGWALADDSGLEVAALAGRPGFIRVESRDRVRRISIAMPGCWPSWRGRRMRTARQCSGARSQLPDLTGGSNSKSRPRVAARSSIGPAAPPDLATTPTSCSPAWAAPWPSSIRPRRTPSATGALPRARPADIWSASVDRCASAPRGPAGDAPLPTRHGRPQGAPLPPGGPPLAGRS